MNPDRTKLRTSEAWALLFFIFAVLTGLVFAITQENLFQRLAAWALLSAMGCYLIVLWRTK